jgi:hypothetical protein
MLDPRDVLNTAYRYFRGHPEEVTRLVKSGFGLRFGVPLAAFRWVIEQVVEDVAALDPTIEAVPPGLKLAATLERMETTIRVSMILYVTRIQISSDQARVHLRFEDVNLKVLSEKRTLVSALINSGALDIGQLGDLVRELPKRPPVIAEATGDRVVLDLMRSPRFEDNSIVRHLAGLMSTLITVHGVQTETEHLDVVFRALPRGGGAAVDAIENHLLSPGLRRVRALLGRDQKQLVQSTV